MDANTVDLVSRFISNVGFPIAAFFAICILLWKQTANHKEESSKWVTALDNNTKALDNLSRAVNKE